MNSGNFNTERSNREGGEVPAGDEGTPELSVAVRRALERAPAMGVPESFAARVARLAVTQTFARRSVWNGFGLRAAILSGILLTGALFGFAPGAAPSFLNPRFDLEMLLLTELGGVAYLISRVGLWD